MRRVVITGMGIVCCLGNSLEEVMRALQEGNSGIEFIPERKQMGFR
nr:beta-ketoacyl-ACP synthase I [candidate division Zixibacteria bacterium]